MARVSSTSLAALTIYAWGAYLANSSAMKEHVSTTAVVSSTQPGPSALLAPGRRWERLAIAPAPHATPRPGRCRHPAPLRHRGRRGGAGGGLCARRTAPGSRALPVHIFCSDLELIRKPHTTYGEDFQRWPGGAAGAGALPDFPTMHILLSHTGFYLFIYLSIDPLNQPQGWIGVISLSLSIYDFHPLHFWGQCSII